MHELIKMESYHLRHSFFYWGGALGVFLLGIVTADSYVPEVMGPSGGAAASLTDIFNGMVYDSTFLLIIVSSMLALILGEEFAARTIDLEICAGHSRKNIFMSKTIIYLTGFNGIMILYPLAGCFREFSRYGIQNPLLFAGAVVKAAVYSLLLNSAAFLLAVVLCFFLQNKTKAIAGTALITFVTALYLGYGMKLKLPIAFLPIYQIRKAVSSREIFLPSAIMVSAVWGIMLIGLAWKKFCRCDLK